MNFLLVTLLSFAISVCIPLTAQAEQANVMPSVEEIIYHRDGTVTLVNPALLFASGISLPLQTGECELFGFHRVRAVGYFLDEREKVQSDYRISPQLEPLSCATTSTGKCEVWETRRKVCAHTPELSPRPILDSKNLVIKNSEDIPTTVSLGGKTIPIDEETVLIKNPRVSIAGKVFGISYIGVENSKICELFGYSGFSSAQWEGPIFVVDLEQDELASIVLTNEFLSGYVPDRSALAAVFCSP